MEPDRIEKRKELLSVVLLVVSAFLGLLVVAKVAGFFAASAKAEDLVQTALTQSKPDPNEMEQHLAGSKAIADELKKKNLFAPPPPPQHPVKAVQGILGDEVIIGDKLYGIGGKIGDAKIVAIEPTRVKIEWDGKEKWFAPIAAASPPAAKEQMKKAVEKKKEVIKETGPAVAKPVEAEVVVTVEEEDPLAWMGVTLSPELRAKLLEHWNKASDEEKEKMKQGWNQIPDDKKQAMIDQMEQNIDQIP
jgi:hypothetical protein